MENIEFTLKAFYVFFDYIKETVHPGLKILGCHGSSISSVKSIGVYIIVCNIKHVFFMMITNKLRYKLNFCVMIIEQQI
jgi:hypothetical protein